MDHIEFGRYLTQQRELRGLSRAEVAKVTKIPPNLLEALETGEVTKLPGRVFIVNYVRAYASSIGLEPEDAVLRYQELVAPEVLEAAEQVAATAVPKKRPIRPWIVVAVIVIALILVRVVLARGG